jgi:arsenate reductase-like glutaredoxin family protein
LLGPTGNLRAPTIKKGKTLFVGFNEEAYQALVK